MVPGTGKTYLAKTAVNELTIRAKNIGVLYLAPTGAELKGKYVGETENIKKYGIVLVIEHAILKKNIMMILRI